MTTTFRAERALQKILGKANGAVLAQSLGYNDDMTAGTAVASKALILDASKGIATITSATITTITNTTLNGQAIVSSAITSGTTDNIKVGAFASTADGSGSILSTTRTACARFYADDGGVALGAAGSVPDVRNLLARTLVTEDATGNHIRLYSLMGQVKAYAATGDVGIWNTEQVAGVYGYLELVRASGTATYGGYGVSAAVLGCIETSGTITVNTNHVFAGVAAIYAPAARVSGEVFNVVHKNYWIQSLAHWVKKVLEGRAKVEIAVVKGKRQYDKRETERTKEADRETAAAIKHGRRE